MNKRNTFFNNLVARNSCISTFLGGSLPARTNGGFKICYRLFSTKNNNNNYVGGGDYYPFKLIINSTYDNIVFTNGKSILFLPCIFLMNDNIKSYDINLNGE